MEQDIHSNSCSLPFASPTAPIQHGAVSQKMEMLAVSVAGQMVAVCRAGTAFPL